MERRSSGKTFQFIILFCVFVACSSSIRYGMPAKSITVARPKVKTPHIISVNEIDEILKERRDVSTDGSHETPEELFKKRIKRSVNDDTKEPEKSEFNLNDGHLQIMLDWAGEGSDAVLCVARDSYMNESASSNVFISYDYSTTFENKTDKFRLLNGSYAIINKFYKNDRFTSHVVFTDVVHKYLYTTRDWGKTILRHVLDFTPSMITYHPTDSDVVLAYDMENKLKQLWLSEDFGASWHVIGIFVKSYYWYDAVTPPKLYVERQAPSGIASVVASQSLFRDDNSEIVIEEVEDFEIKDKFLFAIRKQDSGPTEEETLQLFISFNGGPFLPAEFPNNLTHIHYYIADVAEDQVMACVVHGEIQSNLYVSDVPRNGLVKFSLSLERILYYNQGSAWDVTWLSHVTNVSFADLHRVEGIRGVYIASQLSEEFKPGRVVLSVEHISSYITFDQGAQWKPIAPPVKDSQGQPINCSREAGCSLHLGQMLSALKPGLSSVPIHSMKSAPGLIIASGVVGNSLKGHSDVYVSRDAGVTWHEVIKGEYMYTFGDHGGVLVAVEYLKNPGPNTQLLYSTDEGQSWQSYKVSDKELRIYGLMTEPGENTTIFTLYGSASGPQHNWIVIKVDLRPVFKYQQCTKDDYKLWSPSNRKSGIICLLGRKEVYERRVAHSNCFNGRNYDRPISVENCPCEREDYMCDFGFVVDANTSNCVHDPTAQGSARDPSVPPSICFPGQYYNRTKGYEKIPSNTCEGGKDYLYDKEKIPCPVGEEQEFLLVSTHKKILRYDLDDPKDGLVPLPIPVELEMAIALDFDLKNNCLYWSDVTVNKIYRMCFDGRHTVETLVEDIKDVEGLVLDWVSHNLYFVSADKRTLEVIRTDTPTNGRMRRVLLNNNTLINPRGVAVHPVKGYLFLTDWSGYHPMVARCHLDGSNLKVLFGVGTVRWPNGITIDFQTDRIFWVDADRDYIASADMDGKNMKTIYSQSQYVQRPFAIGIHKEMVYWDDWNTFMILRGNKDNVVVASPINTSPIFGLVDLKIYGRLTQKGTNACGNDTTCKYLCMGTPQGGKTCLCPDSFMAQKTIDGETCLCPNGTSLSDNGLCVAASETGTCPKNTFQCANNVCINSNWKCDGDNDCGDNSDEVDCEAVTCTEPSWKCDNGRCIASTWKCDYDNDCGDNSDEKDCHYPDCEEGEFRCHSGVCINANWRCDMEDDCWDGTDEANCTSPANTKCRATEFTCETGQECLPVSWLCDGDSDCPDGSDESNCKNHTCKSWQFQCDNMQCIYRTWVCDDENDCQDRSDEKNCTNISTTTTAAPLPTYPPGENCTNIMFRCRNQYCIPFWWQCDGLDDCGDNSDEDGCRVPPKNSTSTTTPVPHACGENEFECSSGSCIRDSWVCDGDKDCRNGEDEENCRGWECDKHKQFRCHTTIGCVDLERHCDGHADCADGSDEAGCHTPSEEPMDCGDDFFMCDSGTCLRLNKMCDGNHDCADLSDEKSCGSNKERVYLVQNLQVLEKTNTSIKIGWSVTGASANVSLQFLPSYAENNFIGSQYAWKNTSWTNATAWLFKDLKPFEDYVVKVYLRESGQDVIYPPLESITSRTEPGIPSPPLEVAAKQVDTKVQVSWKPPMYPNGNIIKYHVFMLPPIPAQETEVFAPATNITLSIPDSNTTFYIWVVAGNQNYLGVESKHVQFNKVSVDIPVLALNTTQKTSFVITWSAVPGADGYVISHNQPENDLLNTRPSYETHDTSYNVTGLSPGKTYVVNVEAFKGSTRGEPSTIEVTTLGKPLKSVKDFHADIPKTSGSTIKVSWSPPDYVLKRKDPWQYKLIWGQSKQELKHNTNVIVTSNTTQSLTGLHACQIYLVAVMPCAPLGIGPYVEQEVTTQEDSLAPPKYVTVSRTWNKSVIINWQPSCLTRIEELKYVIMVTDIMKNKTSVLQPSPSKNTSLQHEVEVHTGAHYSIVIKTSIPGSRESSPVFFSGPPIPPPYNLIYNPGDNFFFWRDNQSLPKEIRNTNYSYVLYVGRNDSLEDAMAFETEAPPLVINNLEPGIRYIAAVSLRDQDGYLSPKSAHITFEKEKPTVPIFSTVGVVLTVVLVILALVVVIVVLFVRHRRLTRSFLSFANSHYDRSNNTTVISTDHNLDEDDDSPMIRGFSDDEPLVIA
ncbi:sortilin-related receptor-like [Oratosquilla oratoria]|uniref:sortilin-related receptor-like n=1 Tax=Oratosquilla oratoria TaxID=337810 RepID=UPI003F77820E